MGFSAASFASYQRPPSLKAGKEKKANNLTLFNTFPHFAILYNTFSSQDMYRIPRLASKLKWLPNFVKLYGNNTLPRYTLQPNGFCEKMRRGGGPGKINPQRSVGTFHQLGAEEGRDDRPGGKELTSVIGGVRKRDSSQKWLLCLLYL